LLDQHWDTSGLTACVEAMAEIAAAVGETAWAARLLGAAEANRVRTGVSRMPRALAGQHRLMADVQAALGETAFAAAWAAGRRLSPDEARAEATRVMEIISGATEPIPPARGAGNDLTAREVAVLKLVADGLSDRAIADALFIGVATVRTHLANTFGKLEVGSRTAAVAAARRRGIL
jgi:DNA-binding NarL/FixJ family response regulator